MGEETNLLYRKIPNNIYRYSPFQEFNVNSHPPSFPLEGRLYLMTHFQKKSTEREKYYFAENNPGNHYLNQVMKVYSQWYYVNMICSDTLSWEGHFLIVFFPQTHNPSLIMRKASDNKVVVEGYFPGGPVAGTPYSQCMGPRFNPWSGNYSPHATTKIKDLLCCH